MRKNLMLATLIGFCALSLTACQKGEEKPATPAAGTSAEQNMPANPGSEPLNTASNQDQSTSNGTPDLAASTTNAPAAQDAMQNQSADNSAASTPSTSMPSSSGSSSTAPSTPADQSGAAMQGTAPSAMPSAPAGQTPAAGTDNSSAPASGSDMTPSSGDKTDKTDTNSSMTPDQK